MSDKRKEELSENIKEYVNETIRKSLQKNSIQKKKRILLDTLLRENYLMMV